MELCRSESERQGYTIMSSILKLAGEEEAWREFLNHKIEKQHMNAKEEAAVREFIDNRAYLALTEVSALEQFPGQLPVKRVVNKEGTRKKRIVYSFEGEEGILLKFIAWQLYRYDSFFCKNCYAFRRSIGVREAIRRISSVKSLQEKYCLKADISNYFNSIDAELLLQRLAFVKEDDPMLYQIFERILMQPCVVENGIKVPDSHGAMAGIPIAPFFANVYLAAADAFFERERVLYFRYSDDILIFADSMEELQKRKEQLYTWIERLHLSVNQEKARIAGPGEYWEFLGFGYRNGQIDLSDNTVRKTKAKIKRKADALRRWQRKKALPPDKAAIGLIHAMNRKFYGSAAERENCEDEFTWCRWFLPNLTTDRGLREIDEYLQDYIRYAVTGRHYKGNYRIRYDTLKQWGYRSLVHEFWSLKNVKRG